MNYKRSALMQERLRQNREAILQAAKQLISQGGIKDAQIQAMADLAGVSNGLVYRYFDNKNHIIIEVLSEAIMREIDILGRIGDSEFLLVLPNVSLKNSMIGLERLRVTIESQAFTKAELRLTVSGGIMEYTGESSETLVERCRSLMINAREAGCNRFCLDLDII